MQVQSAIAAHPMQPRATAPEVAASEPVAGRQKLDITRIPFKMVFEVKSSDPAGLSRALRTSGWTATPVTDDCSHTDEGCRYGGYSRVSGPRMTLAEGGLDSIASAIAQIASVVSTPGASAAMRISVADTGLDDVATTNLVNMHLANEPVIYRLSQAGGPGRSMRDKSQWSPPLSTSSQYTHGGHGYYGAPGYWDRHPAMRSISTTQTVSHWKQKLSNYHWGMNSSTGGWWEFRYFDTSMDAKAVQNNVKLLLGMVKAAAEGRGRWDTVRPLLDTVEQPTPRKEWNDFIDVVAPEIKSELESSFVKAGGQLKGMPSTAQTALGQLISSGHRFENAGQPLALQPLIAHLEAGHSVSIVEPANKAGSPITVSSSGALALAHALGGKTEALEPETAALLAGFTNLTIRGISFENLAGTPLSPALAAVSRAEKLDVILRKGEETLKFEPSKVALQQLQQLENGTVPPDAAAIFEDVDKLQTMGCHFQNDKGQATTWRASILTALRSGTLSVVGSDGHAHGVASQAALHDGILAEETRMHFTPEEKSRYDAALVLIRHGYTVQALDGSTVDANSLRFTHGVSGRDTTQAFNISLPTTGTQVPLTPRALDNLSRLENGQEVDADLREAIDDVRRLTAAGCKFDVSAASSELVGRLTGGVLVVWSDPLHRTHSAATSGSLHEKSTSLLDAIRTNPSRDALRETLDGLVANGQVRVRRDSGEVISAHRDLPWLMAEKQSLQVEGAPEATTVGGVPSNWSVPVHGWDELEAVVKAETDGMHAEGGAQLAASLRAIGAQFYYVTPARPDIEKKPLRTEVTLNTVAARQAQDKGVRIKLPHWTIWNGWPRKSITIQGLVDLGRLANKLTHAA